MILFIWLFGFAPFFSVIAGFTCLKKLTAFLILLAVILEKILYKDSGNYLTAAAVCLVSAYCWNWMAFPSFRVQT